MIMTSAMAKVFSDRCWMKLLFSLESLPSSDRNQYEIDKVTKILNQRGLV